MGLGLLALKFLKANWLPILLVVVGLALYARYETVRIERDHYKAQVITLKGQVETLNDQISAQNAEYKRELDKATKSADDITKKYNNVLTSLDNVLNTNLELRKNIYAKDKELTSVKLSLRTVELFNRTTTSMPEAGNQVANTKPENAGNTASNNQAANVTLADLLEVSDENNANHLACIEQVKQWQSFWNDFVVSQQSLGN